MIKPSQIAFALVCAIISHPLEVRAQSEAPAPVVSPSLTKNILVPTGMRVPVSATEKISSATAQVGDVVTIAATEDVIVDGYVVILKGAGGQGEITAVERAHGNGGSGKLGIKMEWITAVTGEKIALTSTRKTASEEDRGGGSSTASILSYALLGPLGLFAHNFAHGKDVILTPTKVLSAYTEASVHIVTSKVAGSSGFAH